MKIQPSKGYENFDDSYPMSVTLETESHDSRTILTNLNDSKAIIPLSKGDATKGYAFVVKIESAEKDFGTTENSARINDRFKPLKFNFMLKWKLECNDFSSIDCKCTSMISFYSCIDLT